MTDTTTTTPATVEVDLPRSYRTTIYCTAAPIAVALLDIADKPIDTATIIHAAGIGLAALGSIVAAAHISGK